MAGTSLKVLPNFAENEAFLIIQKSTSGKSKHKASLTTTSNLILLSFEYFLSKVSL